MKYFLIENRWQGEPGVDWKQEEDGSYSYKTKLPKFLKKYPYRQIAVSSDGKQSIVQCWDDSFPSEVAEISLTEAQNIVNGWTGDLETSVQAFDQKRIKEEVLELRKRLVKSGELNG